MSADTRRTELSQHFLRKGATAARLVHGTTISRSDLVVEIGAGRGALTLPLSRRAGRVIAVEIDDRLAERLAERLAGRLAEKLPGQSDGRVEIVNDDFLRIALPETDYKAFGNVPFALTTDIVRKLVRASNPPRDAWLVVQQDVAHRFCGPPYFGESLWSLRLKPWWHVEIVDRLRRVDFDPPPSVESVLLWLSRRDRPLLVASEARLYLDLIERAYAANYDLSRVTAPWLSKVELRRLASDLRFGDVRRPSLLGFEQWLGIVRFVNRLNRS